MKRLALIAFALLALLPAPAQARRGWSYSTPTWSNSCPNGNCQTQPSAVSYQQPTLTASPLTASPLDRTAIKVDGSANYNAGRVADLPQGAERCYLTVTTSDNPSAQELAVANWFAQDNRLAAVRNSCKWNQYTASNPHYKDRLAKFYGSAFPIVTLQRANGEILLNVTALSLPKSAAELADYLEDSIKEHFGPPPVRGLTVSTPIVKENGDVADCPDGNCPLVKPQPQPERPRLVPDILPRPKLVQTAQRLFYGLLAAVAAAFPVAIAVAVGLAIYYYARNRRRAARNKALLTAGGVTAAVAAASLAALKYFRSPPPSPPADPAAPEA